MKFKVNHAVTQVTITNGNEVPVDLISFRILGRHIGEVVNIMMSARPIWDELNDDYAHLRQVMASDLADEKTQIAKLKNESEELDNKLSHLKQAIELDEKQAKTVSKYLLDIEQQHNNVTEQVNKLMKEKTTLFTNNRKLEGEIEDKNIQFDSISEKLNTTQEKLKTYKSESSIYSEDFSEFKGEINRQNTIYKVILSFLLIVGTILSFKMYSGVSQMSSDLQFNFDIWSLLVSRLPIISLNIFLLGVCSTLIYKMIDLLTKNNERLSLTKQIAYLVKECTDSQSEDLILDDEQILKKRISNKMVLIREFISNQ
ncbi:hypothetical protein AB9R79_23925, partial [Vibrio splendidus]